MFRTASSVVAMIAMLATPAIAADWGEEWGGDTGDMPDMRTTYPTEPGDWAGLGDKDDPLQFEMGVRYYYSMGASSFDGGAGGLATEDETHFGELHLRIDDHSTNSFAKANIGYSILADGVASSSGGDLTLNMPISSGSLLYLGADFGWNPIGDNSGSGAGFLVGYQYFNDSLGGRVNYTTINGGDAVPTDDATGATTLPGASVANSVEVHALRLGVQGKAKLGDWFDVSGELAAVPYANVSGTVGIDDPTFDTPTPYNGPAQFPYDGTTGNISSMRSSPTEITGWGYGAQAEAWLGMHPTENLTFRVGGRASYIQGTYDASYDRVTVPDPGGGGPYDDPVASEVGVLETGNPFSMMRYGLLAEFTYAF